MRRAFLIPLVIASLVGGGGVAAAAPAPSYDALTFSVADDNGPGAITAGTATYVDDRIQVTEATEERFVARAVDANGVQIAGIDVAPPLDRTFTRAQRYSFNLKAEREEGRGAGRVDYAAGTCDSEYGVMSIDEVTSDGAGALTAFAASWLIRCDAREFSGLIRFRSSLGWSVLRADAAVPEIGAVQLGGSVTGTVGVTVVGEGPERPLRPAEYETDEEFTVVGDTCDRALGVGDSCALTVRFTPRSAGRHGIYVDFRNTEGRDQAWSELGIVGTGIDSPLGTYYPTGPTRVLDTRTTTGGHRGALGPGGTVELGPDTGGSAASAYVLNLTAVTPTASGYLTAYPSGKPVPGTASVNVAGGRNVAHLVTVPAGAGGVIRIRNAAGSTHVVADLVGWYSSDSGPLAEGALRGGGFHRVGVQRLLDTRAGQAVSDHEYVTVSARYPGRRVAALAVNITVTSPSASGYVTAWNAATDTPPLASTLNFSRGETVSNAAIIPGSACTTAAGCNDSATIGIANGSGGSLHVIVDITGYFDDGLAVADLRFHPLPSPTRVVDTRQSFGTMPFRAGETHSFVTSVAGPDTVVLDGDITAVRPTASTYLTVWPDLTRYQRPRASNVNVGAGQITGNHVLTSVGGPESSVNVYNFAGRVDVVADVDGTFDVFPPSPPGGIEAVRDAGGPTSDSPVGPVYRRIS